MTDKERIARNLMRRKFYIPDPKSAPSIHARKWRILKRKRIYDTIVLFCRLGEPNRNGNEFGVFTDILHEGSIPADKFIHGFLVDGMCLYLDVIAEHQKCKHPECVEESLNKERTLYERLNVKGDQV